MITQGEETKSTMIYDLSPANKYLYSIGLGFYHTGVEFNGKEYSFGGNPEMISTGVF